MLKSAPRVNNLLKSFQCLPMYVLRELFNAWVSNSQTHQVQCCEPEHSACAPTDQQMQLYICIPSILELLKERAMLLIFSSNF